MDSEEHTQEEGRNTGSLWLLLLFLPIFCVLCQVALCPKPLDFQPAGGTKLSADHGVLGLGRVMTSLPLA